MVGAMIYEADKRPILEKSLLVVLLFLFRVGHLR